MPLPTSEKGAETSLKRKQTECQVFKYGINERNFLKSNKYTWNDPAHLAQCFLLCSHF